MKRLSLLLTVLLFALLIGCGGGGGGGGGNVQTTGSLVYHVDWPLPGKAVPRAANSILVQVKSGTKIVATTLIPKPVGLTVSEVTLAGIPFGAATVITTAFPNIDGTGTPVGQGSDSVSISGNDAALSSTTMESAVNSVSMTIPTHRLEQGGSMEARVSAKDAQGRVVLLTSSQINWSSSNVAVLQAESAGLTANLLAKGLGSAIVTVVDKESQKSTIETVNVGEGQISVQVLPSFVSLQMNDVQQFSAQVTGSPGSSIVWSIDELNGGTITTGGLYTAPQALGVATVRATLSDKPDVSGTATIQIVPVSDTGYEFVSGWGSQGSANGQFDFPKGICLNNVGNVLIGDQNNARVVETTKDGIYVRTIGGRTAELGGLSKVQDVTCDGSGNIYVADVGAVPRIVKFGPLGNFIKSWGSLGSGNGQFSGLYALVADASGTIYAADWSIHRIQKFSSNGQFLMKWSVPGTPGLGYPGDIAVDTHDHVFTNSSGTILKYQSDGALIKSWVPIIPDGGTLPYGFLQVDLDGNIFIRSLDPAGSERILKFAADGNFSTHFGLSGTSNGEFRDISGGAIDGAGNVFVADGGNFRVQKFRKTK